MSDKYKINFSPTDKEISEIEKWLIDEDNKSGEGFYCNWNIITSSHRDKRLVSISHRNKAIGFATFYHSSDKTVKIEIAEVKPTYRKKGVGKKLVDELLKDFKEKGFLLVHLQCSPETSEPIWKRLDFIDFPDPPENYNFSISADKQLFRILTDYLEPNNLVETGDKIELWNDEPYMTRNILPKYTWNIDFIKDTRKLRKPIIHPGHYEWRIRWTSNGQIVVDDKVKYFGIDIGFGTFIIIDELPKRQQMKGSS